MYGLKAQKLLAQSNGYKQHALKGQKLLAQGSALGYHVRKPVALTGRIADCHYTQGAALG